MSLWEFSLFEPNDECLSSCFGYKKKEDIMSTPVDPAVVPVAGIVREYRMDTESTWTIGDIAQMIKTEDPSLNSLYKFIIKFKMPTVATAGATGFNFSGTTEAELLAAFTTGFGTLKSEVLADFKTAWIAANTDIEVLLSPPGVVDNKVGDLGSAATNQLDPSGEHYYGKHLLSAIYENKTGGDSNHRLMLLSCLYLTR